MNIIHKISRVARQILFSLPLWGGLGWGLLTSCTADDFLYQDEARVRLVGPYIYAADTDSLTFSFVTQPTDASSFVMNVDVCVMGPVADRDRTANISVNAGKTTANSDLYNVPATVTIPAGQNSGVLPVTLKRSKELETKTVRLYIEVAPSTDFAAGVNEQNHFCFIWNDQVARPANWDELEEYFGTYSNVKYRFMLANSGGVTEFSTENMSWAQLMNFKIKFQNALNEYNALNPGRPLTDENGVIVTF